MDNDRVASLLREWADLIERRGGNPHRARAYRRGAEAVAALEEPVADWVRQGRDLRTIPGIGDALAARIQAIVEAEGWPELEAARIEGGGAARPLQQARPARRPRGLAARLRGDLHAHTTATDGAHSAQQMVAAAAARGYEYVAITDHSKDTRVAGGLDEARMAAHLARIRRLADATPGIAVLAGAEVDILKDGRLDFPDSLLRDMDVVVCSVHFRHKLDGRAQTERILRGMSNVNADILGHPTGRRRGIRPGMDLDLPRIVEAAAAQGWCIEMNGSPERMDLDAAGAKLAAERGVLVSLDSDAHATWEFAQAENAAREAEKAGLGPEQVLNYRPLADLRQMLQR